MIQSVYSGAISKTMQQAANLFYQLVKFIR